jgi:hypothetical protein
VKTLVVAALSRGLTIEGKRTEYVRAMRQMHSPVNHEGAAPFLDHFTPYRVSRVGVTVERRRDRLEPLELTEKIVLAAHVVSVHRRVAEQHVELTIARQCGIHLSHGPKELLVDRPVPDGVRLRRVLPHLT